MPFHAEARTLVMATALAVLVVAYAGAALAAFRAAVHPGPRTADGETLHGAPPESDLAGGTSTHRPKNRENAGTSKVELLGLPAASRTMARSFAVARSGVKICNAVSSTTLYPARIRSGRSPNLTPRRGSDC